MSLFSCSGQRPTNLGITDNKLAACPSSPNCVSSDASDERHKVLAIKFNALANDAWEITKQTVVKLPRTQIVSETPDYLHAECTSAVFGFVDDLELQLRPSDGIISIRSASRLGHSDFGVNRERVETLRVLLIKQGINLM
ncbi:MAG: DUF1499 domain-containing protein [Gammaproteobacteria bacterium]|nr:DUF1499 domain-containing protein [Gammaproteobacteria bacterium]